ncbi:hypothetical protein [Streptomyces sediminimaris]|uniref:hypothetical protein n=1 Tax=Streptomyces sediminimaris TaxID=3383721 RepID=UPI00399A28A6
MSENYTHKAVRWIAGVALVATGAGVTGCSKGTDSAADGKPTASRSTASRSTAAGPGKQQKGSDAAASTSSAERRSTAEEAVAAWVTAIIQGRPKQACAVMAFPATASSPAVAGTPATCNSDKPEVRKVLDGIGKFRASFTPKGSAGDPKVVVAQVPVTGDKAVVPAGKVTVDGQTLDKVVLSNSTGVKPGQLDVRMESTKIDGAWYVTDFDLHVG